MMKEIAIASVLLTALALPGATPAQASSTPQSALAPIAFLLGSWTSAGGTVSDTGETAAGRSTSSLFVKPPGASAFMPIATGTMHRSS